MSHDTIIEDIYRQAFVDVLHAHAADVLCDRCSKLLESDALDRYKVLMAKRREELAALQTKAEEEKQRDDRYREFRGRAE
jgi:hypothetical protein